MKIIKELFSCDGTRKVEIYQREDGSFGFGSMYFSDDPREMSWCPLGGFSACYAENASIAEREARGRVDWLREEKDDG